MTMRFVARRPEHCTTLLVIKGDNQINSQTNITVKKDTVLKKIALIIVAVVGGFFGVQAKVDYNALEVEMRMNPDRYRQLMERFENADTTLTNDELTFLYYGAAFTPSYAPGAKYTDIAQAIEDKNFEQASVLADKALQQDPMSLELNILALEASEKGANDAAHHIRTARLGFRCDMIANTILESGRGTNAHSPFVVTSEADMMRIMRNVLGVSQLMGRTTVGPIDALKFNLPGNDRMHILYFDNTRQAQFEKNGK